MDLAAFGTALLTLALIYGLLAIGLNLQFGFAGVLNFGYVAFFAVGAFTSALVSLPPPGSDAYLAAGSQYEIGLGLPVAVAFAAAGVAGALLAVLVGVTSIRLKTHYLAVATFATAEVLRSILANETWLTRGEFGITHVPQPGKGDWVPVEVYPYAYLAACLAIVAVVLVTVRHLGELPFGRLLRAIRDDELAARCLGKPTTTAKLQALMLGGLLGGLAGSLWTHSLGVVHVGQFVPIVTFQIWLAMLLGGTGNHLGVLLGAGLLTLIREGTRFLGDVPGLAALAADNPSFLPSLRFVLIGLLLILVVRFFPDGVLPERRRKAPPPTATTPPPATIAPTPTAPTPGRPTADPILRVEGLQKHYGGLAAVDGTSFAVRRGSITGLIGPNGAGKSTVLDLISGVQRADAGRVWVGGEVPPGRAGPAAMVRAGVARSFQTPRLFVKLTVWENLMVAGADVQAEGLAAAIAGIATRQRLQRETAARADAAIAFLNLGAVRDTPAGQLSGGQRKLLALGQLMLLDAPIMLLDEPVAGVNRSLANEIFEHIAALNRRGTTFLIVEHEMPLVMRWCDPVVVMHQGRVLAEGPPAAIQRDPRVLEAYLGGVPA